MVRPDLKIDFQMMSQLESNVNATNEMNLNMRSYLTYQNRILQTHMKFNTQLSKEKEQLRTQVATVGI